MSARRGWVRAQERGRVAVARELWMLRLNTRGDGGEAGILDGRMSFDVHRAREHARSLIALDAEQSAFEDWTRTQGLGPECGQLYGEDYVEHETWPGRMPARWARIGGDRRAPMGRAYARLGRRILDALDGQPDACPVENCAHGWVSCPAIDICPWCDGTSHNLRGVLAPIEWSPQVRRRRREVDVYAGLHSPRCWLHDVPASSVSGPDVTRVAPRGEHRTPVVEVIERNGRRVELRDQARGWIPKDSKAGGNGRRRPGPECWPRWKHGENRHAEQRRTQDLDRQLAAASLEVARNLATGTRLSFRQSIAYVLGCAVEIVGVTEHRERGSVTVSVAGSYTGEQVMAAAVQFVPTTVRVDVLMPATIEPLTITGTITV